MSIEHKEQQKNRKPLALFRRMAMIAQRAGLDGFILGLLLVILLAYQWPSIGAKEGLLPLPEIATYGVSLIFFFYGLRLDPEKLRAGLRNWRLHLLVHGTTFLLFPLLILVARLLWENQDNEWLWLGIFFLAALPSTVSSAVVMVSIAGGNIPAAIFNASISSLIGILMTPLWMSLVMQSTAADFDFWTIISRLLLQVLLPVVLGMVLRPRLGTLAERHRQKLRYFDQAIILLIVYTSFCESFAEEMFSGYSAGDLLRLSAGMLVLFLLVCALTYGISQLLRFNREDRITAVFCGSKKSLVHGSVMAKVLFPGSKIVGIILLPIMLYHALQLVAVSMMAQALAQRQKSAAKDY